MALIRWNPSRGTDLWNMQREINRMFDSFFQGGGRDEDFGPGLWTPAVDIAEQENDYVVKIELPGISKDDVKITLESNILTIRGEKKREQDLKEENYHRVERSYGAFQRSFTLPTTVRSDKIDASYKDGILTVLLPKAEEAKPKQIEVKVK